MRRRSGQAKEEVLELTKQTGQELQRSLTEARRLAAQARRKARGCGASSAAELENLGVTVREVLVDGGFKQAPTDTALEDLADTIHITGGHEQGSRRTRRRRQRYPG